MINNQYLMMMSLASQSVAGVPGLANMFNESQFQKLLVPLSLIVSFF